MTAASRAGSRSRKAGGLAAIVFLALVQAACGDDGATTTAGGAGQASGTSDKKAGCPSPTRPVAIGTPSAWEVIGRTGPDGPHRDKDVSESRVTVTNPNDVPVRAKVIVLLGSPALGSAGALVEYGVPHEALRRADGGLDYAVTAVATVPPGDSVEMAARMLTIPAPTVRALYGFADIVAPRTDTPCNIPVAGADPITLLGSNASGGCTDPAAGC